MSGPGVDQPQPWSRKRLLGYVVAAAWQQKGMQRAARCCGKDAKWRNGACAVRTKAHRVGGAVWMNGQAPVARSGQLQGQWRKGYGDCGSDWLNP
jgi:hypothetical protein